MKHQCKMLLIIAYGKDKKGGRPAKRLGEKRRYTVSVKLNTREFLALKAKAGTAGISRSEFIRQSISGSVIRARITPEMNDHIRKLAGMGNNLNQIARRANAEGYRNARSEYLWLADKIDNVIEIMRNDG